jgi:hypothetical protein
VSRRLDDCQDSGCIFRDRTKPGGMRTQGGCQHLKLEPIELRRTLMEAAAELTALRRVAEAARVVVANGPGALGMGIRRLHDALDALTALHSKEGA